MKRPFWLWLAATLALAAGVVVLGSTQTAMPQEGSRGLLYEVSGGKSRMYLLGSIHIGNEAMYPFGEEITQAMAASDTFVYECDTVSADAVATMRQSMVLRPGQSLRATLGDALLDRLSAVCDTTGLRLSALETLQPWAVINTLAVYATAAEIGTGNVEQAMALGVEKKVQAFAEQNHKQAAYLETIQEQLGALEGFSPALQRYLLSGECDVILNPASVRGMDATIAQWPAWWRTGDAQAFADHYLSTYREVGFEAVCDEYHSTLVTRRNARMADRLDVLLQGEGAYFVTVGLLHLTLPGDSILAQLQQKGYTVTRLALP